MWALRVSKQLAKTTQCFHLSVVPSVKMTTTAGSGSRPKKQLLVADRDKAIKVSKTAPLEPEVDVDDIQGDALCGFNKSHMAILAFDIVKDDDVTIRNTKKWLADFVIPNVTSARDVMEFRQLFRVMREKLGNCKPTTLAQICLNTSFSYDALHKLAPSNDVEKFNKIGVNEGFQYGLPARSTKLNDPKAGIGAMKNWKVGAEKTPDILIQIASDRECLIKETIDSLVDGMNSQDNPVKITYKEFGKRPEGAEEHFGFHDGISNMGFRGTYKNQDENLYITPRYLDREDKRSKFYGLPGQLLIWPGETVLGLPKQNANTINGSNEAEQPGSSDFAGPEWAKNGTYLVFRRLKQDVPKFWKFMKESADEISNYHEMSDFTEEHMAAKVVARWKSGAPILRTPTDDNPDMGKDPLANNAFVYSNKEEPFQLKPWGKTDGFPMGGSDPLGEICPLAAHLRKVHPRDEDTDIGNEYETRQRRIIRRGIMYGEPIQDVMVDDGKDRGLLFVCYQASIDKQFEFLITKWANSPDDPNDGGHDMIIGQSSAKDRARSFQVPLSSVGLVKTVGTTDEWVIPTGGGYFFVPSISALKNVITK